MAIADLSAYNNALKEIWTEDRLEAQYYTGSPLLESLEKTDRYNIGRYAVTPISLYRTGGYTVGDATTGAATLNPAGTVGINSAQWKYSHHYVQVKIEGAAVDQTKGNELAVANAVDTELNSGFDLARKQVTRQLFSNGDALIAQTLADAGVNVVRLDPAGFGPDALKRRWLHVGLTVDIGTTANEKSVATARQITAVDLVNNTITVNGTTITPTGSTFVSIANARVGTTSNEANGLRNVVSPTGSLGGINPSTVTDWAATVDSTTTALSVAALLDRQVAVQQEVGSSPDLVVLSFKQANALYKLLQDQVRFSSDGSVTAGANIPSWNGMTLQPQVDCPDRFVGLLTKKALFLVTGGKPYWQNEITGGNPLEWLQTTTAFGGLLAYRVNLATNRRNAHSALTALTA